MASSKITQAMIKGNRVFATTTSWVIVKNQLVIHLSIGTIMRLAIRSHAQKSRSNNKAKQGISKPSIKHSNQSKSKIFTNTKLDQSSKKQGDLETEWTRVHMA